MLFLFNFATDFYNVVMIVLPFFCYVTAVTLGIFGILILYRMGDSRRVARGEGTLGVASLILAFILVNYAVFVDLAQHSFGFTAHTVSYGGGLLLYQTTPNTTLTGTNPVQLSISIIQLLWRFFAAVGLLFIMMALMRFRQVSRDLAPVMGGAFVMFVCGVFLMNVDVWAIAILQQYA